MPTWNAYVVKRNIPDDVPRYYCIAQIARLVGRTAQTVRNWIRNGRLDAIRPGRDYLISDQSFEKFMRGNPKDAGRAALRRKGG